MVRSILTFLLLSSLTIFIASCGGATITKTETLTQNQTVTKTETLSQSPVTRSVEVTKTVYPSEQQSETVTTPTSTSTPTATTTLPNPSTMPTTHAQVPTDYTTYTSNGLFSISYPSDWELLNYLLEDLDSLAAAVLSSIDSGAPLDQTSYMFFAGLPTDTDWIPSINIVIESLPFSVSSLEEVVNAEVLGIQHFVDTYIEISREYVQVDGRDAAFIYWEGISGLDSFSNLQVYMFIDDLVWIMTLTPPPGEYYFWEEDFYNIANSIRYLK